MKIAQLIIIISFSFSCFSMTADEFATLKLEMVAVKNKTQTDILVDINSFEGSGGVKVGYTRYQKGAGLKGAVVISIGRAESSIAYYDQAKELIALGYSPVYALDHRGQGFSDRLLWHDQKGHVDSFDRYGDDFEIFMKKIVTKEVMDKKLFLMAHSMGAAITANSLLRYENRFQAVAYISPMFKIILPQSELETLDQLRTYCSGAASWVGICKKYVPGGKDYDEKIDFKKNRLTGDENRLKTIYQYYDLWQETRVGSPTLQWLNESIRAIRKIRFNANQLDQPTLILQAGNDEIVDNQGQDDYCVMAFHCHLERFEDSKHGILMERDEIRQAAFQSIDRFFQQY